jgi:hypothetical protein
VSSTQEYAAPNDPFMDGLTALAKLAVSALMLTLLTPVVVGFLAFRTAPAMPAQRAWFWRARRSYTWAASGGVLLIVVVAIAELADIVKFSNMHISGWADVPSAAAHLWPWVAVNFAVSPAAVPVGLLMARRSMAAQVASRTMPDAVRQDRIEAARHAAAQRDAASAASKLDALTATSAGRPVLGVRVESGVRTMAERARTPRATVPGWETAGTITLPEHPSAVRSVVLAEAGHGKTVLLTNFVLAACRLAWRVVFIDAKGQHDDARAIAEAVEAAGATASTVQGVRVLGEDADLEAAYEVLTVQWPASDGAEDFYRARHREVIRMALRGRPRDFESLLGLMQLEPDSPRWRGVPADVRATLVADAEGKMTAGQSAAIALRQAWGTAGEKLSGEGLLDFRRLTSDFVILPVRPRQQAERQLGLAAMLQFGQHLSQLQAGEIAHTPLLVIVDEFPQLVQKGVDPSDEAASLMETARSAGLGLIVAAQSTAGLSGDPAMRARLLLSGASVVLGATKDPTEVISLAGTHRRLEAAEAVEKGALTSGRSQDAYVIAPDRVRAAPIGVWWLIHKGAVAEFVGLAPAPRPPAHQPQPTEHDKQGDTPDEHTV